MSERDGKLPHGDTLDTIASSRTLPSQPGDRSPLAIAATVVAPPSANSGPRLPRDGGEVLGNRYEILEELGRGGEGVVYRVRDLKADTIVALKLLQQEADAVTERLQRFRRELQMARKVTHPNVVRIHDLVELPNGFGLAMELVEGESLKTRIARGPLSPDEMTRVSLDLATALAAAHEAGVTHRDLKPENVLLRARDGRAMVADFGISRLHGGATGALPPSTADVTSMALTREGALIGTPLYMAPEQLAGRTDIGPTTDVYAFGLVMYEAATGAPAHPAETLGELVRMRQSGCPAALRARRPELPKRWCEAIDKALSLEPKDRWADGAALVEALAPGSPPSRRSWPFWVAGAALVGALCGGAFVLQPRLPASPPMAAVPPPPPPPRVAALHTANVRRLTFGDSCEEFPSFTSDGQRVVYDATVGANSYIYALDLAPNAVPVQLTHVRGWDIAAAASPRGDRIAFVRILGDHTGAFVAPIDGSQPPRELTPGSIRPSWTHDGKGVWASGPTGLTAYDADTGAVLRALPDAVASGAAQTVELSDGSLLAAVPMAVETEDWTRRRVDLFPVAGGVKHLIDAPMQEVLSVTPDGSGAIVSRELPTGLELLDVPLDGSPPTSLAFTGIMAIKGLTFSSDGKHVVWSTCGPRAKLVAGDEHGRLTRAIEPTMTGVAWVTAIPGTDRMVVVSDRTGKLAPWLTSASDESPPRPIAVNLDVRQVAASSDGARMAFTVPGDGIYVASLQGSPDVRRLTDVGTDAAPAFERGDRRVLFARRAASGPRVMAVPVDGSGIAEAILDGGGDSPATSPARDEVVYLSGSDPYHLLPSVWDPRTGTSRPLSKALTTGRYSDPTMSPDGLRVTIVRHEGELVEVEMATGAVRRTLITPTSDELQSPAYTAAGLVAVRVPFQGNVWVADLSP